MLQKELHNLTSDPSFSFRVCDTTESLSTVALALAMIAPASPEKNGANNKFRRYQAKVTV